MYEYAQKSEREPRSRDVRRAVSRTRDIAIVIRVLVLTYLYSEDEDENEDVVDMLSCLPRLHPIRSSKAGARPLWLSKVQEQRYNIEHGRFGECELRLSKRVREKRDVTKPNSPRPASSHSETIRTQKQAAGPVSTRNGSKGRMRAKT